MRATTVQRVARDWLNLVDRGDYSASWNAAGAKFKLAMQPERWAAAAKSVRGPLGFVEQRTVFNTSFTKTFPGAPEGDYALVVFRNLARAVVVTPAELEVAALVWARSVLVTQGALEHVQGRAS